MKQPDFTQQEKNYLLPLLEEGKQWYLKDIENTGTTYLSYKKALESLQQKLTTDKAISYTTLEMLMCIQCIRNSENRAIINTNEKPLTWWLSMPDSDREILRQMDMSKEILVKCGYYKNIFSTRHIDLEYRHNRIMNTVEKLKQSSIIYLSRYQEQVYKIGFVYNLIEWFCFDLNGLDIKNMQFSKLPENPYTFGKSRFEIITSSEHAYALLSQNTSVDNAQTFDFCRLLLVN